MTLVWAVIGIIFLLVILEIWRETHTYRITKYQIVSEKLNGIERNINAVFLSDLHNHVYGERNQKLLNDIKKLKPDLILVGGDMVVSKRSISFTPAVELMQALTAYAPVYCGNGNHEQRFKEQTQVYEDRYERYKRALESVGVRFLENETEALDLCGGQVEIGGLEIPLACYRKFYERQMEEEEKLAYVKQVVGNVHFTTEGFRVLLAHDPTYGKQYAEQGADLTLSGHLHGGIVRIPFFRGVITPQAKLFPKYYGGNYKVEGKRLVVSKGLGTHTVNLRLFNEAEVVWIQLSGKRKEN